VTPKPELLLGHASASGAVFYLSRKHPDQEEGARNILGRISSFPRGRESPHGYVIALRDATELQRIEQLKSEFICNVAHKLRSPLTVIEGDLPMLRRAVSMTDVSDEILQEIERNSEYLCRLIDKFVEFSDLALRSSGFGDVPRLSSVSSLVDTAIERSYAQADTQGVRVVNRVSPEMPPLLVRARHLTVAMLRIIENAVKFSETNTEVVVDAEVSGSLCRIHVTDQGPGIPPGDIEAVFCVGHQVDQERTGQVPGAGMGLTIARHLIRELGGEITILSPFGSEDRGTRVTLTFALNDDLSMSGSAVSGSDERCALLSEVQHGG